MIANSEEDRWILLKQVQRAFTPDPNPSPFNENLWKELSFLDNKDASKEYREDLTRVYVKRGLKEVL